ncbi:hypothetical protein VPH35_112839 [Triticum aestivum]
MPSVRLSLQRGCTAAEDAYLERLAREKGLGNSSMSASSSARTHYRSRFSLGGRPSIRRRAHALLLLQWTVEEDARLERLARENRFRHWRRVARRMPGRSRSLCRARWRHLLAKREVCYLHTALAALSHRDEDELLSRDWMRRWTAYRKKAAKSSPEKAQEYWREFMKNAATGFAEEKVQSEPEPASPAPMQRQHPLADVLASGLSSCSLAPVDPRAGSLALGLARMTI